MRGKKKNHGQLNVHLKHLMDIRKTKYTEMQTDLSIQFTNLCTKLIFFVEQNKQITWEEKVQRKKNLGQTESPFQNIRNHFD